MLYVSMPESLISTDQTKYSINHDNPLILMKAFGDTGSGYERGCEVYPIKFEEGNKPKTYAFKNIITVAKPDVAPNLLYTELGEDVIPLEKLVEKTGRDLRLIVDLKKQDPVYNMNGNDVGKGLAVERMLDYYNLMRIPKYVRNSSRLSKVTTCKTSYYERGVVFDKLSDAAAALFLHHLADPDTHKNVEPRKNIISVDGNLTYRFVNGSESDENTISYETSGQVDKVDGKYVLMIPDEWGSNISRFENKIRDLLHKEKALERIESRYGLTEIDDKWYGIDLDKAFKNSPLNSEQISNLAKLSVGEIKKNNPVKINETYMYLNLGLRCDRYLTKSLRAGDNRLFLKVTEEQNLSDIEPYFYLESTPFTKNKMVNPEEKTNFVRAQHDLSNAVCQNLGRFWRRIKFE